VLLANQTLTPFFSLTVPNFVVFFSLLNRKFNEDSKNVLKTVIFLLQVGFTSDFVPECPFKLFLAVQTLTPFSSLAVPNFVVFFMLLDRKFNEDYKTAIKTVIFSFQVGFTGDYVPDCPFKLYFWQFKL